MDEMLHESQSTQSGAADNARGTMEDMLWFVLKVFLLLGLFQIVSGMLSQNLIILTNGFYFMAGFLYVTGLLLAYQESRRLPDQRYPYGYGNRAAVFQLVAFCLMGSAAICLFFFVLPTGGAVLGRLDLQTFLTPVVTLGVSISVYIKVLRPCLEADDEKLDLDTVLIGAIIVSGITLAAVIWRRFFGGGSLAIWVPMLIIIITLCLFVKAFYRIFLVVTDRSFLDGAAVRSITGFVRRAAGEGRIVDVKTRNVGKVTHIEVRAAFPPSYTIAEVNAIERDIERLLRRKVSNVGQVVVYWQK